MNALVPVNHYPVFNTNDLERIALAIAKGRLFGSSDPNAVMTLCLLAQAEGKHPASIMQDFHIIQGKPAKKAEAMLRDFINAGGKVEWHQLDDTCADATFSHPSGSARIDWTMERAKKAGISTPMWSKYPRQMLRSRVISEGIRTVYPGATSGLYEEAEVRDIVAAAPRTADEAIEALIPGAEIVDVTPREQIKGIHKIKERLRLTQDQGNHVTDLEAFNAVVGMARDDLQQIKDANHEWWTGDGEDFEGFKSWIKRRREELAPIEMTENGQMCLETLAQCTSKQDLDGWFKLNWKYVEELDGAERDRVEARYQELESGYKAAANVSVG